MSCMKIIFFTFLLLFITLSIFSQEEKKVVFGVKAGANMSHNSLLDNDLILGFQVGIFTKISLTKNQALVPEILHTTLRSKSLVLIGDCGNETETEELKTTENHILFDIGYTYSLPQKIKLTIGPSLDYFYRKADNNSRVISTDSSGLYLGFIGGVGYTL